MEYLQDFSIFPETRTQDLQKIVLFLEERCRTDNTVFVHGHGKRKNRNQRYVELFRRFLERQTLYNWHTEQAPVHFQKFFRETPGIL